MGRWVISQKWANLVFINYRVDPEFIQSRLPKGMRVDTFEGSAYLSIVPFQMDRIRFPFTPPLPFSRLLELNIRTYVTVNGIPGIYFFTLDTDHWLGATIARNFFHLPYRHTKLSGKFSLEDYFFQSSNFQIKGMIGKKISKDKRKEWIVERYSLFTDKETSLFQGVAMHDPWSLRSFQIQSLEQSFLEEFNFDDYQFVDVYYADPIKVKFKPFTLLGETS